jgi:hypothetical protein
MQMKPNLLLLFLEHVCILSFDLGAGRCYRGKAALLMQEMMYRGKAERKQIIILIPFSDLQYAYMILNPH